MVSDVTDDECSVGIAVLYDTFTVDTADAFEDVSSADVADGIDGVAVVFMPQNYNTRRNPSQHTSLYAITSRYTPWYGGGSGGSGR